MAMFMVGSASARGRKSNRDSPTASVFSRKVTSPLPALRNKILERKVATLRERLAEHEATIAAMQSLTTRIVGANAAGGFYASPPPRAVGGMAGSGGHGILATPAASTVVSYGSASTGGHGAGAGEAMAAAPHDALVAMITRQREHTSLLTLRLAEIERSAATAVALAAVPDGESAMPPPYEPLPRVDASAEAVEAVELRFGALLEELNAALSLAGRAEALAAPSLDTEIARLEAEVAAAHTTLASRTRELADAERLREVAALQASEAQQRSESYQRELSAVRSVLVAHAHADTASPPDSSPRVVTGGGRAASGDATRSELHNSVLKNVPT